MHYVFNYLHSKFMFSPINVKFSILHILITYIFSHIIMESRFMIHDYNILRNITFIGPNTVTV